MPEAAKNENLIALANMVVSASLDSQLLMRADRLLIAVLQGYRGRPNLDVAKAVRLLVVDDDENSDFDYESE